MTGPLHDRSSLRRGRLTAYGVPLAAVLVMTGSWVHPGRTYAYGDVGPFVRDNLTREIGSLWNHQTSGFGAPGFQTAQLLEVVLLRGCALVGLGPWAAQWLWFLVAAGAAALGCTALARIWLRSPWAAAAAGVLAVGNVYMLTMLPNPLPLLAVGLAAGLPALVLRHARGRRIPAALFVLATLPASYLAINPPLLALVGLCTAGAALACGPLAGGSPRRAAALLLRCAPLAVLAHVWWLAPLLMASTGGGGTSFAATTDVQSWAWTHTRASVANVTALNPFWAWREFNPGTAYTPYSSWMESGWWPVLRWVLPVLALLGAVFPPGGPATRRALRTLAAAVVVLILLCKGLNPPFAGVNLWLFQHVPGAWLFREPASKLGTVIVVLYALLAGAAVQRAAGSARRAVPVLATVCVCAALAYPLPLWTGEVATARRFSGHTAGVTVPDAWYRLADRVNSAPGTGKVLQLPLQSFYMATTDWGYQGVDNVPQQLITRPFLQRLPGGYFSAPPVLGALLERTQQELMQGHGPESQRLMRSLGISHILLRRDLVPIPGQPAEPIADVAAGLARVPGVRLTASEAVGEIYEVDAPAPVVTAAAADGLKPAADAQVPAAVAERIATGGIVAKGPDTPVAPAPPPVDCSDHRPRPEAEGQPAVGPAPGGAVRLTAAGAYWACADILLSPDTARRPYTITFDYRVLAGGAPGLCVYRWAGMRCEDTDALGPHRGWTRFSTVLPADPRGGPLSLALSANGLRIQHASVEFRDVRAAPLTIHPGPPPSTPPAGPPAGPGVTVVSAEPGRFAVTVSGATGHSALVLREAYADGWEVTGLPRGWSARHVVADGWANAWEITGSGTARLTLDYRPARWARAATVVSAVTVALLCAAALSGLLRRRPRGIPAQNTNTPRATLPASASSTASWKSSSA